MPYVAEGACWWNVTRVLCNQQLQEFADRMKTALVSCNDDKAAIREWGKEAK